MIYQCHKSQNFKDSIFIPYAKSHWVSEDPQRSRWVCRFRLSHLCVNWSRLSSHAIYPNSNPEPNLFASISSSFECIRGDQEEFNFRSQDQAPPWPGLCCLWFSWLTAKVMCPAQSTPGPALWNNSGSNFELSRTLGCSLHWWIMWWGWCGPTDGPASCCRSWWWRTPHNSVLLLPDFSLLQVLYLPMR